MTDLEKNLQEKSTSELQNSLKYNLLVDHASLIARAILEKRGATVPEPIPEEAIEENYKKTRRNSNRNFLITILLICLWAGYGYIAGVFEHGQEKRLNQSMLITFLLIASVWGWDVLRRKK